MQSSLDIAFFTEAGSKRGLGHLLRSLTIAESFESLGHEVSIYVDSDINLNHISNELIYFKWNSFKFERSFDIIFIDSYQAAIEIYEVASKQSKEAVFIDDFRRLDYPKGIILNFAVNAEKQFFKKKNSNNRYLLGLNYLPIRDSLKSVKKAKSRQIIIMLGGVDTLNLSPIIVEILGNINIKKIVVVSTESIAEKLKKYSNINVLYKPEDTTLALNMANSQLAISTASMTLYELSYLKIPTIAIAVAQNQLDGISQFLKHNIAYDFVDIEQGGWQSSLREKVLKMLSVTPKIPQLIDGKGCDRITYEVLKNLS